MDAEDLSQLSLYPATTQQTWESRKRTAASWATGMTVEQYLERDRLMDGLEHANDGKLITWVLAPRNDPFTLDFKCSCETFRRIGIVVRPTSNGQRLTEVPCYGVASVYTPPQHRKKGYAAHMMRLIHWVLAPEGSISAQFPHEWGASPIACLQDAVFSVLYSDIGDAFYHQNCSCLPNTKLGWVTTGIVNTSWPVTDIASDSARWKFLPKEDAIQVWDEDTRMMKEDALSVTRAKGIACSFLPDKGLGRFTIDRNMRFKDGLTSFLPLEASGVQLDRNSPDGPLIFATWTLESAYSKTLVLTRLRATKETFGGLLAQIMAFARRHGLETIETWNLPEDLSQVAKELGGRTFERDQHLSSIKWYGQESEDEIQWLFNEKFCWC